jgi:hypothetical protein
VHANAQRQRCSMIRWWQCCECMHACTYGPASYSCTACRIVGIRISMPVGSYLGRKFCLRHAAASVDHQANSDHNYVNTACCIGIVWYDICCQCHPDMPDQIQSTQETDHMCWDTTWSSEMTTVAIFKYCNYIQRFTKNKLKNTKRLMFSSWSPPVVPASLP